MTASTAPDLAITARSALRISARSLWSDQVWHLDGHRPGANRSDFSLDWGFALADDSRFSDPQWADWREAVDSDDSPDGIPIKNRTRFRELAGRDSDLIPDSFST